MAFAKSTLMLVMSLVGAQALQCYSGNTNDGNIAPKTCDSGDKYCVKYIQYRSGGNPGNTFAFCDYGLWCDQQINQTGSEYLCCQTDLCNEVPNASPAPPTTPAAPLTCYSGSQNDGNVAPQLCPAGSSWCFIDHVYAGADYPENYYGGCDDGLWCNQVINQTGSEYRCCQSNLCNEFPVAASSAPAVIVKCPQKHVLPIIPTISKILHPKFPHRHD